MRHLPIFFIIYYIFSITLLYFTTIFNPQAGHENLLLLFGYAMAQLTMYDIDVYQSRQPKASGYYKLIYCWSDPKIVLQKDKNLT